MKKRTAVLVTLTVLVTASSCRLRPMRSEAQVPIESPAVPQVERVSLINAEDARISTPAPTAEPVVPVTASPSPAPTDAPSMTMETAAPTPPPQSPVPTDAPAFTPAPTIAPTMAPTMPSAPIATPAPTPAHIHEWTAVTETFHHEAVTEQVKVIDQPGTEGHFEGGSYPVVICRCGEEFTTAEAYYAHTDGPGYSHGGFTDGIRSNQVWVEGTPEVFHYETVVEQDAWDEEIVTGYRCACGAMQ